MEFSEIFEKIIPSAVVAFLVSVVWAAIHEGSKARRAFILNTSNELKKILNETTRTGCAYWLSAENNRSLERLELTAKQAEIVGLISLLEKFGYQPGLTREDYCDALTGGDFDTDGQSDQFAAARLNSASIVLRVSIDDFTVLTVKRPILRFFLTPFRLLGRLWNKLFN